MSNNIPDFSPDDVISFTGFSIRVRDLQVALELTSKDANFVNQFHYLIRNQGVAIGSESVGDWGTGIQCEALKLSDPGWHSGKLKLRLCLDFFSR